MTKEEAMGMVRDLGYGDVTEEQLLEVLGSDKELSDESLGEVAGGTGAGFEAMLMEMHC